MLQKVWCGLKCLVWCKSFFSCPTFATVWLPVPPLQPHSLFPLTRNPSLPIFHPFTMMPSYFPSFLQKKKKIIQISYHQPNIYCQVVVPTWGVAHVNSWELILQNFPRPHECTINPCQTIKVAMCFVLWCNPCSLYSLHSDNLATLSRALPLVPFFPVSGAIDRLIGGWSCPHRLFLGSWRRSSLSSTSNSNPD